MIDAAPRILVAAAAACVLLCAAPAASAAGPQLRAETSVRGVDGWALATPAGPRLVLDVRVRHGSLQRRAVAVDHRHRILHASRLRVVAGPPGSAARPTARLRAQLPLTGRRAFAVRHRLVLRGLPARRALAARRDGRLRLAVRVDDRVAVRGEGRADRPAASAARRVRVRSVVRPPPAAKPVCEPFEQTVPYRARTPIRVVCAGHRVAFELASQPRHGRARLLGSTSGRARLAYRPQALHTGGDRLLLRARAAGGPAVRVPIQLDVEPFELRALGDSVTAGYGFMGDGSSMSILQFPDCIPPDQPNDRCSSNSSNGEGSTAATPGYLPDYGLSNNVSWPAQFANSVGLTDSGMFENRAVSGSTPAQWGSGYLRPELDGIVADSPNLTVMTLGANPLLDEFLIGPGIACGAIDDETLFKDCIQAFIDGQDLRSNLAAVVEALLAAPGNAVVVSQYHLSMPSVALAAEYTPRKLELMAGVLNSNVRSAVQSVDGYGERAFLMAPPRFNVGLGPGSVVCPGTLDTYVDGPSRQSAASQLVLAAYGDGGFCGSPEYWIISGDDGIHPSRAGHAQFANSLRAVVQAHGLLPKLP